MMRLVLTKHLPAGQFGYLPRGTVLEVRDDNLCERLIADHYAEVVENPSVTIEAPPIVATTSSRRRAPAND